MQEMLKEVEYCRKTISTKFKKPIQMTDEKEILLRQVEQCHICGQKYKEWRKKLESGIIATLLAVPQKC